MRKTITMLAALLSILLLLAACSDKKGGNPAQPAANADGPLTREQAIDVAAHHLMGKPFDATPEATVAYADGKYTVDVVYLVPGGGPGDTYTKKVVFDARTKELLELEVVENKVRQTETAQKSGAPDLVNRSTALGEEKDPVADLQKQLGR